MNIFKSKSLIRTNPYEYPTNINNNCFKYSCTLTCTYTCI